MAQARLPKTPADIYTLFQGHSDLQSILKHCNNPSKLTPAQAVAWKYAGGALLTGRPLDTVMIYMAGVSGAGKSSTINSLFDDNSLCATSESRSETKDPVLIQKQLCVTKESPYVIGNLSFIDVPGTFDTDSKNEVVNLAAIRKFTQSRIELISRKQLSSQVPKHFFSLSETVYPNVILFVVKATENRVVGPDSFFRKSLQVFKDTANLVDTKNPNVIVVLTHAASMARKPATYIKKLQDKIADIQGIVREVLGIVDVPVVPVENDGEGQDLDLVKGFYKLPNGEQSHYNLFEAMIKVFERNNDLLGKLLVGWYFHPDCPEKKKKAEVIKSSVQLTDADLAKATANLQKTKISVSEDHLYLVLNFQSLGYGYCPVTEEVKPVNLLQSGGDGGNPDEDQNYVQIENAKFCIPKSVIPFVKKSSRFHRLSFYEQEEYQSHMKASYGIEAGFKLVVSASSEGRWVNNASGSCSSSLVSLVQEIQVATFKLDNPKQHVKCANFHKELQALPDCYSDATASDFQSFFSKWGSHLVYEQAVGGAVTLNCTMEKASLSKDKLQEIEAHVSAIFKGFSGSADGSHSVQTNALRSAGVSTEHLQIDGGDPPALVTLESMNSTQLQEWSKTVAEKPTELRRSIKLYPYYNFLDCGPKYNALHEATRYYLENSLSSRIHNAIEKTRKEAAEKAVNEAVQAPPSQNCFPKGTMVQLWDGTATPIEDLTCSSKKLKTLSLGSAPFGKSIKLGGPSKTDFCTFLDLKNDETLEYLVFQFSNGKRLIVSEGHMIFQYVQNENGIGGAIKAKQAKNFKVGDMTVYCNNGEGGVEMPKIVEISREMHSGAYSPLTMSGTFIADGFLVSSYANTDSFAVAQAALLPLKIWTKMSRIGKGAKISQAASSTGPCVFSNAIVPKEGIHPFAKFLISFRKSFTTLIPNYK